MGGGEIWQGGRPGGVVDLLPFGELWPMLGAWLLGTTAISALWGMCPGPISSALFLRTHPPLKWVCLLCDGAAVRPAEFHHRDFASSRVLKRLNVG